jgi:hypothetical protein
MEPTGTVTRRVAKGIPPRVRSPPRTKKKPIPKKVGKNLKRHASESSDEEVKQPNSGNSVPKATKKINKKHKRQRIEEPEEEEEIIDENVEPPIEDVEDVDAERSGDEVSKLQVESSLKWRTHAMLE